MATKMIDVQISEDPELGLAKPAAVHASSAPQTRHRAHDHEFSFDMLANPKKAVSQYAPPPSATPAPPPHKDAFEFDDFADDGDDFDDMDEMSGYGGGAAAAAPPKKLTKEEVFKEKLELMHKLHRMKEKGYDVQNFDMTSDLDEMRFEYDKLERSSRTRASVNMMRQLLIAGTSGMQFMNNRYDPIGMKLDGWSESIMANITDYDGVFERLHDKYGGTVSVAPEIELLVMVGSSAIFFHMSQSMMSAGLPSMDQIAKTDPELMKSLLKVMMNNSMGGPPSSGVKEEYKAPREGEYVMRGPGGRALDENAGRSGVVDFDKVVQGAMSPRGPQPAVIDITADDNESVADSVAPNVKSFTVSNAGGKKKKSGAKKAKPDDPASTIVSFDL